MVVHLFVILIIFIVGCLSAVLFCKKLLPKTKEILVKKEDVYAIMITGKTTERISKYAKKAVEQFFQQKGNMHKHMIVINHSEPSVKALLPTTLQERVFEYQLHPTALSLGEMRNLALSFVPPGKLWITWDDDDIRHPHFVWGMLSALKKHKVDAVAFCKRYEYNVITNFSYMAQLETGFPIIMCKSSPLVKYSDLSTMEDLNITTRLVKEGLTVHIIRNNPPQWYIRLVHDDNTSLYVNKKKEKVYKGALNAKYKEFDIPKSEQKWVKNLLF